MNNLKVGLTTESLNYIMNKAVDRGNNQIRLADLECNNRKYRSAVSLARTIRVIEDFLRASPPHNMTKQQAEECLRELLEENTDDPSHSVFVTEPDHIETPVYVDCGSRCKFKDYSGDIPYLRITNFSDGVGAIGINNHRSNFDQPPKYIRDSIEKVYKEVAKARKEVGDDGLIWIPLLSFEFLMRLYRGQAI